MRPGINPRDGFSFRLSRQSVNVRVGALAGITMLSKLVALIDPFDAWTSDVAVSSRVLP